MDKKKLGVYTLILLVGIGISFAYFVGRTLFGGEGAMTHATTASINNAEVTVTGNLEVEPDLDMLPGHKIVSHLEVTAKGDNILIPFNLIWKGTNGLETSLKVTVYKAKQLDETIKADCEEIRKTIGAGTMVYEECDITNLNTLGTPVGSGTIPKSESTTEVMLAENQFINATPSSSERLYYYVILEYPNDTDNSQNSDMGEHFEGEVTVEASDIEADIDITTMYAFNKETGKYEELIDKEIPENQVLDMSKTKCEKGSIPTWDAANNRIILSNYTSAGEVCELYFKQKIPPADETLADLFSEYATKDNGTKFSTGENGILKVTGIDEGDNGKTLYKAEDNDGPSYFFRGQAPDNWVQFANMRWRIIRINGDGTIRMIFQCSGANCTNTIDEKTQLKTLVYNSVRGDNTYVGYYNLGTASKNYDEAHTGTNPSTIAAYLNDWYGSNLSQYEQYIDQNAGFCNDRQIVTGVDSSYNSGTGYGTSYTSYAMYGRVYKSSPRQEQLPTLKCGVSAITAEEQETSVAVDDTAYARDLFTRTGANKGNGKLQYPIGLITADEVVLAGGFYGRANSSYYLYTNQDYWTMSPYYLGTNGYAYVLRVNAVGTLMHDNVSYIGIGVRPVINLKAGVTFSKGSGSSIDPFIVEGAE